MLRLVVVMLTLVASVVPTTAADAGVKRRGDVYYLSRGFVRKASPDLTSRSCTDAGVPGLRAVGAGGAVKKGAVASLHLWDVGDGDGHPDDGMEIGYHADEAGAKVEFKTVLVCIEDPSGSLTYNSTQQSSTNASVAFGVGCSSGAFGGGGGIRPSATTLLPNVRTTAILLGVPVGLGSSGTEVRAVNGSGQAQTYVAHTVCSSPRPVTRIEKTATIADGEKGRVTARCPSDTIAVAGGGSWHRLLSSAPWDGRDRDRVPDDGWSIVTRNTSGTDLEAKSVAICLARPA